MPITVRLRTALQYEVTTPSHFCFNLEVMRHRRHRLHHESLQVHQGDVWPRLRAYADAQGNRFLRFDAEPGALQLSYEAHLDLLPAAWAQPGMEDLPERAVTDLPDEALPYLMPSRYCESDLMSRAAQQLFGKAARGSARVHRIIEWIQANIAYQAGTTNAMTSAKQVFVQRAGVCRDFAHLGITFCRALNIPARLVVGYVYFDEPPQDFHALFEAWLGDQWVMFDPTGLARPERVVRVGQGTDAKDVAFLTAFGALAMKAMRIDVEERNLFTGERRASAPEDSPVLGGPADAASGPWPVGDVTPRLNLPAAALA